MKFVASIAVLAALAAASALPAHAQALKDFGSFHIGGRPVTLSGLPVTESVFTQGAAPSKVDPNGDFEVEQMYVQYMIPEGAKSKYPLLLWHGGGLTGTTWETKPDGQPGWMNYFFRAGHPVYVSDSVERGRASWARYPEIYKGQPIFRTKKEAWEVFRFGPVGSYDLDATKRVAFPGVKFPVALLDQFAKQAVPRWTTNDAPTIAAYNALVQKVGPAVIMVHSQGGNFGFQAALAAPDKVKGLILLEPSGAPKPGPELDKLKDVPILIVWGDNVEKSNWARLQPSSNALADYVRSKGGNVEIIELPKIGITGNSHMMMMDTNSDQVAGVVQDWMTRRGLMR
ncbi:MAG: alpha/beta fold hydrolase [Pseudomonadota bacterium]